MPRAGFAALVLASAGAVACARPAPEGPDRGGGDAASPLPADAVGSPHRITPLVSPAGFGAPADGVFGAWLHADGDKKLDYALPAFGSARCGETVVSREAAAEAHRLSMKNATDAEKQAFARRFGVDFPTAARIYTGYYVSLLRDQLHFHYVDVMFGRGWHEGTQPILRGHVLSHDGAYQNQLYWRDGVFQKEFRHATTEVSGVRPSGGYGDELMPAPYVAFVPGEVEGALSAGPRGRELWIDGKPHPARLSSGAGGRWVQTWQPCAYRDESGRGFDGAAYHSYTSAGGREMRVEVEPDAVIVRAEINHGNGGKRIDWLITGVAPVAGVTIDAADVRAAEERFTAHVEDQAEEIERLLATAEVDQRRTSDHADADYADRLYRADGEPRRERQSTATAREVRYLWDAAAKTLLVLWVETRGARWSNAYEVRTEPPDCPLGAPCAAPPPSRWETADLSFAVETAVVYELDATGALVRERALDPRRKP